MPGAHDSYIALLTEMNDDSWQPHFRFPAVVPAKIEIRGSVLLCPWPVEEQRQNKHHIYLEDGSGKELDSVVALQEPDLFQQFEIMACVIFSKTIAGVSVVFN